ncbi:hypothetical protein DV702_16680 [Sporosarcina sp. PTS2304]|uniref:hypothetical protein n=1 Tax=Sporosarcina sp. PTS2304 TaxID=2283194 RepID=UPI000E0D406A|nr:hypothetical protein [Sporosarcina sp. PTS2304]AXI01212.1 hypothetical protein DV702_16680 [Sporosarcina sp. PTS2304]
MVNKLPGKRMWYNEDITLDEGQWVEIPYTEGMRISEKGVYYFSESVTEVEPSSGSLIYLYGEEYVLTESNSSVYVHERTVDPATLDFSTSPVVQSDPANSDFDAQLQVASKGLNLTFQIPPKVGDRVAFTYLNGEDPFIVYFMKATDGWKYKQTLLEDF